MTKPKRRLRIKLFDEDGLLLDQQQVEISRRPVRLVVNEVPMSVRSGEENCYEVMVAVLTPGVLIEDAIELGEHWL